MAIQMDAHRAPRGVGAPYVIKDGQREYVKRQRGQVEVAIFPAAGGQIIARGVGRTEAEARASIEQYK